MISPAFIKRYKTARVKNSCYIDHKAIKVSCKQNNYGTFRLFLKAFYEDKQV